ncbi:carboxypeptidase regulatory-like domain-containing protein [Mucilaginibacter xinganensis]|uniref:TonB-dependent receptor plug domain-containing protein n=1 Tax=Mucilaginibacter xinganensis TaxID=1234841 RepID=A0A223P1J4_9SPHI|nr:carboxypeptidase regulatory-like domain-containing protein [Mucilaginibacter xinganensis]ASU36003.1 hypothetical protein MuYL_4118 [Mucilaginibacter xinganensis]
MLKAVLTVIILLPLAVIGQITIKGRIVGSLTTRPIADASVFLSNATNGDKTGNDGVFTLKNVKPGKYELVISHVSFDTYKQTITVENSDINLPDITLYPRAISLNEVKIKPNTDPDWKRNYEWFKDEFLGKSTLAKNCKILNPEMLELAYDEKNGILTASSADFLIIDNKALGYRLKYLLSNFVLNNYDEANKSFSYAGSVFFERLKGTAYDEKEWAATRQDIYEGSQMQFLRAALNNRIEQDGFRVYRLAVTKNPQRPSDSVLNENIRVYTLLKNDKGANNYKDSLNYWIKKRRLPAVISQKLLTTPLTKAELFKQSRQHGLFEFTSGGTDELFISYNKYHHFSTAAISHLSDNDNTYATLVSFNEPVAFFDSNGSVTNPRGLTYEGVWSRNRVAALLPVDYEPTETTAPEADSTLIKNINTKLDNYTASHITEKAYLHFDKPYYAAGDTIYFKAYVTSGNKHEPSTQSGVLYADLVGPDNKISNSIQLQLKQGSASGDFALADTLTNGSYRVRAYTKLMRNEAVYYDQSVAIGSINRLPESGSIKKDLKNTNPDTRFLPEGGSLVTGVKSKIAFKAIATNGSGIEVKGTVLDNDDKEIVDFTSTHLGMGYFYLTPATGKTYRARLTYTNGKQDIAELPRSTDNGICMEITGENRSLNMKVSCSKLYYQNNKDKLFTLITYSGGSPFSLSFKLDKQEIVQTLSKKDLRMGIARSTLFSANGEPLCERLLFVQNDDLLKININSDRTVYNKRQKASIQLKINNGGEPAAGSYSVSVTDEDKVKTDEAAEPTIINYLLLTAELKGYIEQPNYYFTNISDKTVEDLDLVMLTHGYRSFEWKKILESSAGNVKQLTYLPEKGLEIAGYVKSKGKAVPNASVKLFTKGNNGIILDTTANENGRFVFDKLSFGDTTKFVLQARAAKGGKEVDIEVDKQVEVPKVEAMVTFGGQKEENNIVAYVQSSKQFYEEQKKYGINQQPLILKEVLIKDRKKIEKHVAHSDNLNGNGAADQIITAKELEDLPCSRLIDCLQAKLLGIVFSDGMLFVKRLQNTDPTKTSLYNIPMLIIVDGTVVDYNIFNSLNSNDIEGIEVLMGPHFAAIYGSQAAGGALIITTKRGRKTNNYYRYAPGVVTFMPKGFYKAREFYSPQYDNPKTNQKITDLRSTIYWNPNIITDKDGKASFSYFNADGKGTYRVVIEGIDADGNLGRQVYRYKVE